MNMKLFRVQLNKTQQEVADDLGIQRTKYARIENGESDPSINLLIMLSDYFHTTIDNLLGHNVPYLIDKSKFSDTQLEIISILESLTPEQCKLIKAYIDGIRQSKI